MAVPRFISTWTRNQRCRQTWRYANIHYVDWSTDPAPAGITREHLNIFKCQDDCEDKDNGRVSFIFARKFNDSSEELLDEIEENLK